MNNLNETNTIRIAKDELVATLKSNLVQHRKDVAEALEGRRDLMKARLELELKSLKDESYQVDNIIFEMPKDMSKEYETAIKRFQMEQQKVVTLTEHQFNQLVMDEWVWKADLLRTATLYGKG